jgi:dihydrolipoamide dehydrogenase
MNKKDVVVIGAGPGGYVAAIRLAQLGKSVAVIDKGSLGGVCLNWGCIPSKALIHAAKLYEEMANAEEIGIKVKPSIDFAQTQKWKQEVVKKLTGNIGQLLKTYGVEIIKGEAMFEGPHKIKIKGVNSGQESVEFGSAIVATGSKTIQIPGFDIDGENVVDSKQALEWTKIPKRLAIIGGGVIGMEIGMLYQKLGTEVTVVEMMDQLLPGVDAEIAQSLGRICKKRGIQVHLSSKALEYKKGKNGLSLEIETPSGKNKIDCDVILLSIGRSPNGAGLGLDKIGVNVTPKGQIPVNSKLQTSLPHIFAIGDVAGPPQLAHKASKEGLVAAEIIAGHNEEYDVRAMPGAIFTDPEIATVGLSEAEAQKQGIAYFVGKFPFAASGRALSTRHTEGMVKIVAEKKSNLILGCHIIGPDASDLIGEATLAIEMGATVEDLALTVHPHPTLSESLMECGEAALERAIHILNRPARESPRKREVEKHA